MFLKIRLSFKNYDVPLWVKKMYNVVHNIFVVALVHINCFTKIVCFGVNTWKIGALEK